jgi:hypothetical protein
MRGVIPKVRYLLLLAWSTVNLAAGTQTRASDAASTASEVC